MCETPVINYYGLGKPLKYTFEFTIDMKGSYARHQRYSTSEVINFINGASSFLEPPERSHPDGMVKSYRSVNLPQYSPGTKESSALLLCHGAVGRATP